MLTGYEFLAPLAIGSYYIYVAMLSIIMLMTVYRAWLSYLYGDSGKKPLVQTIFGTMFIVMLCFTLYAHHSTVAPMILDESKFNEWLGLFYLSNTSLTSP